MATVEDTQEGVVFKDTESKDTETKDGDIKKHPSLLFKRQNTKHKMKAELERYREVQNWNTEQVVAWLKENEISERVFEPFQREGIVGADLRIICRMDLEDMNIRVGDCIRVLRLLSQFKYVAMVADMTALIWEDIPEWHLCPCWPIFKMKYSLTKTVLTVKQNRCFGQSQDRIDLSQITDIDFLEECITSTIMVTSEDVTSPYIEIKQGRGKGVEIFDQLRDAWEIDQQTLASARFSRGLAFSQ